MTNPIPIPLDLTSIGVQPSDVLSLAIELLKSEHTVRDGHGARTLAKSKGLTVVLTVVPAGGNVGEHPAPGPVVIVPLVGTATFHSGADGEDEQSITIGQTLFVGEGQRHRVTAREDCAFLIIIGLQA